MTADPKLVEAVARALWDGDNCGFDDFYIKKATAALAAINASGEWWLAPVELETEGIDRSVELFDAMRTAYLAKTEAG